MNINTDGNQILQKIQAIKDKHQLNIKPKGYLAEIETDGKINLRVIVADNIENAIKTIGENPVTIINKIELLSNDVEIFSREMIIVNGLTLLFI